MLIFVCVLQTGLMASPYKETLMTNLAKGEKEKDDEVMIY
jgi:hypothetical protein